MTGPLTGWKASDVYYKLRLAHFFSKGTFLTKPTTRVFRNKSFCQSVKKLKAEWNLNIETSVARLLELDNYLLNFSTLFMFHIGSIFGTFLWAPWFFPRLCVGLNFACSCINSAASRTQLPLSPMAFYEEWWKRSLLRNLNTYSILGRLEHTYKIREKILHKLQYRKRKPRNIARTFSVIQTVLTTIWQLKNPSIHVSELQKYSQMHDLFCSWIVKGSARSSF